MPAEPPAAEVLTVACSADDAPASTADPARDFTRDPVGYDLIVWGDGPAAEAAVARATRYTIRLAWVRGGDTPAPPGDDEWHALATTARRLYDVDTVEQSAPGWRPPQDWEDDLRDAELKEDALDQAELFQAVRTAPTLPWPTATDRPAAVERVALYGGPAALVDSRHLRVGDHTLEFARLILAPQTVAAPSALPGAACGEGDTPIDPAALQRPPRQLAIIGHGAWACRWAQIFARFGSDVHLLATPPALLPETDPEAAAVIAAQLQAERVRLYLGCGGLRLSCMNNRKAVVLAQGGVKEMLLVDAVLVEPGRRWELDALQLAAGNVAANAAGIVGSARLQTTNPRIFLAGEACPGATRDRGVLAASARLAVDNALRPWPWRLGNPRFDPADVPRCVDLDPQIIQWGPPAQIPAASAWRWLRCDPQPGRRELFGGGGRGLLKVAVDPRSGQIKAFTAVARSAAQWVAPLLLLARQRRPLSNLRALAGLDSPRLAALRGMLIADC